MNPFDLQNHIVAFIAEIEACAKFTTFANDRPVYLRDIATASSWLVKIYQGVSSAKVIEEIQSPQTDKALGDYWRQDEWGEREDEGTRATPHGGLLNRQHLFNRVDETAAIGSALIRKVRCMEAAHLR
jgi:hypothetical protein